MFVCLTHNVGLRADGDETVDVLADGHKHLAGHVTALLRSWRLVLNVDAGRALLNEKLGKLHDGGQTTMASIGISNDRAHVVDVGTFVSLVLGRCQTFFSLFSVVEQLSHEEVINLLWHAVHGVIC